MQETTAVRVGYEQALRVIGRHLDAEPAYHVSVLEGPFGFTVRCHPSRQRADLNTIHYTWERLNDLVVFQSGGRGVPRRRSRQSGMWESFPNAHEDFFRALGCHLDEQSASSLSVDEVNEGVALSYLRPDPANPVHFEKVHTIMHCDDIEALLMSAHERRSSS